MSFDFRRPFLPSGYDAPVGVRTLLAVLELMSRPFVWSLLLRTIRTKEKLSASTLANAGRAHPLSREATVELFAACADVSLQKPEGP